MAKKYFFFFVILFFLTSNIFAQKRSANFTYRIWSFDKPSIELSYGLSDIKFQGQSNDLSKPGMIELKLGFTTQYASSYSKKVLNYHNRFLFLSHASSDLSSRTKNTGLENRLWRFGFGNKEGYGIKLGSVSLMPYNSNSFAWSRFEAVNAVENTSGLLEDNFAYLNDFNKTFRFGSTTEGGINIQLAKGFSIQPKYEISDIYPRHLFGKQLMSTAIEAGGLMLIDGFTKAIMGNAPVAGTFVNFILKNAYEYGFYQLRKDKMNWPFTSAAPLRYNTFKLGMTFTF